MTLYRFKKSRKKERKINLSQFNFRLLILSSTIVLILVYLISINNTATKGIEISQMEREIEILSEKNRSLEIQTSQLKSLERIETLSNLELSMVASDSYQYLPVKTSGEVAVVRK